MGQSTDAILTYGLAVEEGTDAHDICEQLQDERYSDHTAATKLFDVEAIGHCSGDYRMYLIGVESLTKRANRGYPIEIDPTTLLKNEDEARDKLKSFCAHFGLPFAEESCKWILASDWC